ncbi:MAG: hypothetical protein F6J89_25000 [Symploca sp. SIO1C4]|uniref:Rho termination factor-like N-terminal domain-containing protein n=1 Tax=Symploca sp. SIO1C4 TaxID=2607765 RepID=A0A6B3NB21_9CYAN|nr:hypothetical protein [Symploca sp. SIO1C4]
MSFTLDLTEQVTLARLRQQAQRLGIKGFFRMRKHQLLTLINHSQKLKIER